MPDMRPPWLNDPCDDRKSKQPGRAERHPGFSYFLCTRISLMRAACWIVERPRQSFPGCCAAPSARLRASSTRYGGALLIRGPPSVDRSRLCGAAWRTLRRVRDTSGICSQRRVVICPSGGLLTGVSSPLCKNISLHPSGKSSLQIRAIPLHKRGVSRSSRTRGGMRWTRQRFARDGIAGRCLRNP